MNRVDFNLSVKQNLKPEDADFFEAYASYIFYNFFRLSSRAADEAVNRQCCESPERPVLHRPDVRGGGNGLKSLPVPQSVRRFYYGN
jgi:hypothetical protein